MKNKVKLIMLSIIIFIGIDILIFLSINRDKLWSKPIEETKISDGSINILIIEPDYFNPLVSKNKYVQEVANLVFEGLTSKDSLLKAKPQLAKLLITEDNLTWEITLRDDVVFHSGDKFTSDDVIFTVNKIKELGESSYFLYNVQNIKSLEKVSEYKLLVNLNDYDNFFPDKLTFPILSQNYYQGADLFRESKYIGTGPYKIFKYDTKSLILENNDEYYSNHEGNIKNINVKIIEKTRPGFELLKLGEIDIADTNTEVGAYGRSAYNSKKYVTSVFEGINFGINNEILKDTTIRQAILLGINRDNIIEKCLNGYGMYADIPFNPASYLYENSVSKYAFNPERAQDLLVNSGWELKNGVREKSGQKLEIGLLINGDSKNAQVKTELIKNDLNNIGIKINVISKSAGDYNYLINKGEYDLAIVDWAITEYPEFLYNFESNSLNNVFGFSDEEYDYLVYLARREILEGKSQEYFSKMQGILLNKLPIAGLYFETSTVYYGKNFLEELEPKINNIYDEIEKKIIKGKVD